MAEDDQDRAREAEAEREAEIESEMERIGRDPDEVREGSENLGTQSAESGTPRDGGEGTRTDDSEMDVEDAREGADERRRARREDEAEGRESADTPDADDAE